MRDPQASLAFGDAIVTRHLHAPLAPDHFLRSDLARRWSADRRLVPFELTGEREVQAERLPFVSQPTEWCDAQFFDAASLTLDLQAEAVDAGFDLKDASAWNVLFDGTAPIFCDLLSFVPLADRKWWAAGQFARHFLLPLAVARLKGLPARSAFLLSRDGLSPEDARRLFGVSRFLTRYWPLMAGGGEGAVAPPRPSAPERADAVAGYRRGLQETFRWMLGGTRPRGAGSHWSRYRDERGHYAEGSVDHKRTVVGEWLSRERPAWVLDLGCNTGEFSRLAADAGARVVAVDGDHDAVQALYLEEAGRARIHPVVAALDDLSGGRGWAGAEHPALVQRLEHRFDVVLVLALIHHLMVSCAIPVAQVAVLIRRFTRHAAVVEWIDPEDPQMRLLCAQRQRDPAEFTMDAQRQAFLDAGFEIAEEVELHPGSRRLARLHARER